MLYTGADALNRKGVIREELWPSHYRNRESSVHRQAAQPHLEDCGIYRMRWWAGRDPQPAAQGPRGPKQGGLRSAAVPRRGTGLEGPLWASHGGGRRASDGGARRGAVVGATPSGLVMSPGDVRAEP